MATVLVNAGKGIVTNRIIGGGTEPKWAAIGTGVGTAAIADTTLFTEVETRVGANAGTQVTTTTTSDAYQVVNTVAITAIRAITNAGFLDAVTAGNLFIKGDFATINLVAGDSLQLTGKVTFA